MIPQAVQQGEQPGLYRHRVVRKVFPPPPADAVPDLVVGVVLPVLLPIDSPDLPVIAAHYQVDQVPERDPPLLHGLPAKLPAHPLGIHHQAIHVKDDCCYPSHLLCPSFRHPVIIIFYQIFRGKERGFAHFPGDFSHRKKGGAPALCLSGSTGSQTGTARRITSCSPWASHRMALPGRISRRSSRSARGSSTSSRRALRMGRAP